MPPRVPYSQYRAQKLAGRDRDGHGRYGSVIESETDIESIFSTTTHQSRALSSASASLQPPHDNVYLDPSRRSLSSSSHNFSPRQQSTSRRRFSSSFMSRTGSDLNSFGLSVQEEQTDLSALGLHDQNIRPFPSTSGTTTLEHQKDKRRKSREERSTLAGAKYKSPLRRWIRWTAKMGWSQLSLWIPMVGVHLARWGYISTMEENFVHWKRAIVPIVVQDIIWWIAICWWVQGEGRRGGRSSRSQTTGVLTVILSPSFFPRLPESSKSLMLYGLKSLTWGSSLPGLVCAGLMSLVGNDMWPCAVTFGVYIVCQILLKRQYKLLISLVSLGLVIPYLGQMYQWVPSRRRIEIESFSAPLLETIAIMIGQFIPSLPAGKLRKDAAGDWIYIIIQIIAFLPPLLILLYSNYSLQPYNPQPSRRPPTYSLLPFVLVLTSIPAALLVEYKDSVTLTLTPLTLMMALRGGAARGSDGVSTEDEVWQWGVWLNVFGVSQLAPRTDGIQTMGVYTVTTGIWAVLIGKPAAVLPNVIRTTIHYLLEKYARSSELSQHVCDIEDHLAKGVLILSWFWCLRKLIEAAWAMGGLSGKKSTSRKSPREIRGS